MAAPAGSEESADRGLDGEEGGADPDWVEVVDWDSAGSSRVRVIYFASFVLFFCRRLLSFFSSRRRVTGRCLPPLFGVLEYTHAGLLTVLFVIVLASVRTFL